ncbi:hypothetical protein Tco_1071351 [Tanacetum coccineum]
MSDSKDSTVTYTTVSSPFGGLSYIRSPGVDGPPVMLEDPYAYVVAAFQAPTSPDYVSGPKYLPLPEFVPEAPLPAAVSPNNGGDDDDDDDESSDDDEDDDDDAEEDKDQDKEEEEEYPASADSVPPPVHRVTARMSIRDKPPTPFCSKIPSPPLPVSSPVLVSPPPLPASPTYPLGYRAAMIWQRVESPSTSHSLPLPPPIILSHTRAYVVMMRATAPSTYILASRSKTPPSGTPPLLPIPLPIPSPPLFLPSNERRADRPAVSLPPRKRLCIALGPRYEVGESSFAPAGRPTGGFRADYGFVSTLDREIRRDPERDVELGQKMTNFVTTVRQDTDEIYKRLDEAQEARAVLSGWLNLLGKDRHSHAYTALLMEREARLSREAWGRSMDASDTARSEVRALRTTVLAQQTEITALRAADRARQA